MGMGRGREYGLRREADWGSWDIDMGLRASEEGMQNEFKFAGDVRKGDGCGWPKDCCEWDASRAGGGCVLGVILGARGVIEV
jgi:hypothetical protein